MKRYFDLNNKTYNNFCDEIDASFMVEIPDDGKPYGIVDGEVVDISDRPEYIAEQKCKLIQDANEVRRKAIDNITNSVILDQLLSTYASVQYNYGEISEAEYQNLATVYNGRLEAKAKLYAKVKADFYATTGLIEPTNIGV